MKKRVSECTCYRPKDWVAGRGTTWRCTTCHAIVVGFTGASNTSHACRTEEAWCSRRWRACRCDLGRLSFVSNLITQKGGSKKEILRSRAPKTGALISTSVKLAAIWRSNYRKRWDTMRIHQDTLKMQRSETSTSSFRNRRFFMIFFPAELQSSLQSWTRQT